MVPRWFPDGSHIPDAAPGFFQMGQLHPPSKPTMGLVNLSSWLATRRWQNEGLWGLGSLGAVEFSKN